MNTSVIVKPTLASYETFMPLAEVKEFCKIRHSKEDTLLDRVRAGAIRACQQAGRISLLPTTIRARFRLPWMIVDDLEIKTRTKDPDGLKRGRRLLYGPVASLESVSRVSRQLVSTTVDPASYQLDTVSGKFMWKGYLDTFVEGEFLDVIYTAGFDPEDEDNYEDIACLRLAVGEVCAVFYENRGMAESVLTATATKMLRQYWTSPTYA